MRKNEFLVVLTMLLMTSLFVGSTLAASSTTVELEIVVLNADGNSIDNAPIYFDGLFMGNTNANGSLTLSDVRLSVHEIEIDLFELHRGYTFASIRDVYPSGGVVVESSTIDRGKIVLVSDIVSNGVLTCEISMRDEAEAELGLLSSESFQALPIPGTEQSTADKIPWAGYWWPLNQGKTALGYYPHGAPGPLAKYDQYVEAKYGGDSKAKEWELANHYMPGAPGWFGHCHAWAAAAVAEEEPRSSLSKEGIIFYVGDLKALLTECYYNNLVNFQIGTRFDPTQYPGHPYGDVYANDFTIALRRWIKDGGEPLVMDYEPGPEVWNHPFYRYYMTFTPATGDRVDVTCTVWHVKDGVHPDHLSDVTSASVFTYTYQYWITVDGGGEIVTGPYTSGWISSRHPDFLWHPAVPVQTNPYLSCEKVGEILGKKVGAGRVTRANNYYTNHQLKIKVPVQQYDPNQQSFQLQWQVRNPAGQIIDLPQQSYTISQQQQDYYPNYTIPPSWQQGDYDLKITLKDGEQQLYNGSWILDAFSVQEGTPTQIEDVQNIPSITYTTQGPVDLVIIDNETGQQVGKQKGWSPKKHDVEEPSTPVIQIPQATYYMEALLGPETLNVQATPNPTEGAQSVTLTANITTENVSALQSLQQQQQQQQKQTITITCPKDTGYTTQVAGQQSGQYTQTITSKVGQQTISQQSTQQQIQQGQKHTSTTQVSTQGGQFTTQQSLINIAPVADAGPYQEVTVGQQVDFDGSGSYDLDGTIVEYHWHFGDGAWGDGVTLSHTYASEGTYTAYLKVWDDDGAMDMDFTNIFVVPPGKDLIESLGAYPNPFDPCPPTNQTTLISAVGVQGLSPLEVMITRDGWPEPVQILQLTEFPVFVTPPIYSFSEYQAAWDGKHMLWGTVVPDGEYTLTISKWGQELASGTVIVNCGEWTLESIKADPNPFNPNVESTQITVTGAAGVGPLELMILREGWWEPVQVMSLTEGPAGTYTATWNGTHITWGTIVPNGTYILSVTNATGTELISGTVTVRSDMPLTSLVAEPDPFNPVIGETTLITATGTPGLGPLELWILKEGLWEPIEILPMIEISNGTYTARWDGKHMHGYIVPDGEYILSIGDEIGELISGTVTVDSGGAEAAGMRIKLTWNTDDTDVDLHLAKPGSSLWSYDDCYYANDYPDWDGDGEYYDPEDPANNDTNDPYLDVDDTDGYGPEHITIYDPPAGTYSVGVHYWSDHGYGPSDVTVTVTLFEGTANQIVETFGPHSMSDGDVWYVTNITMPEGTFSSAMQSTIRSTAALPEKYPPKSGSKVTVSTNASITVAAAEYFIDIIGDDGTGQALSPVDGVFDSTSEAVTADVDVSGLTPGNHTLFIHGKDTDENWGAFDSVVLNVVDVLLPDLALATGYNMISLPLNDSSVVTASDLATKIGTACTEVIRWDSATQAYVSHIAGLPVNDFDVVGGEGYFVNVNNPTVVEFTGTSWDSPFIMSLVNNFNLIGMPFNDTAVTSASSLATKIGVNCTEVIRWDSATQAYVSHIAGLPVNDFDVVGGKGYFVNIVNPTEVTFEGTPF